MGSRRPAEMRVDSSTDLWQKQIKQRNCNLLLPLFLGLGIDKQIEDSTAVFIEIEGLIVNVASNEIVLYPPSRDSRQRLDNGLDDATIARLPKAGLTCAALADVEDFDNSRTGCR